MLVRAEKREPPLPEPAEPAFSKPRMSREITLPEELEQVFELGDFFERTEQQASVKRMPQEILSRCLAIIEPTARERCCELIVVSFDLLQWARSSPESFSASQAAETKRETAKIVKCLGRRRC